MVNHALYKGNLMVEQLSNDLLILHRTCYTGISFDFFHHYFMSLATQGLAFFQHLLYAAKKAAFIIKLHHD
eukprot:jgi/Pico_ML_1/54749/g617.t1